MPAKPLIKSQQRISDFGEVFTPTKTVQDILDQIPDPLWADPEAIFLEPTCGHGNFVLEIVKYRLIRGLPLHQAVSTCFGMDICSENVQECRNRIYHAAKGLIKKLSDLVLLVAIVRNNFFTVDDSLAFMRNEWADYPQFQDRSPEYQKEAKKRIKEEVLAYFKESDKGWFEE
jgi:hypothetical protein